MSVAVENVLDVSSMGQQAQDGYSSAPEAFKADIHLAFRSPAKTYSLSDLGINQQKRKAPCNFGVAEPFSFLSKAGVDTLLKELTSETVQNNCKFSTDRTPCCLRGTSDHSPFIRDLWSSPEVTDIVSAVAGIPLQLGYKYEIAHTNVQVDSPDGSDAPVDNWHYDSIPFVAVTLLTPTEGMTGGETVLKKGDGSEMSVGFPQAGYLIVLQGQHVRHLAKRAVSPHGRMTMVTGYIPADPLLSDQTVLRVSKMMSDLPTLFHQWAQYRLERFGKQAQLISQSFEEKHKETGQLADMDEVKAWCNNMIQYLQVTIAEVDKTPIAKYSDTE
ncbi:hypothetical protein WJX77_009641 [Trebouxia sp. C0004]